MTVAKIHYETNRFTAYEVVLHRVTGETVRLGFTPRRSFQGLMAAAQCWGAERWAALGVTESTRTTGTRGRHSTLTVEGVGTVCFSGETKYSLWCREQR